MKLVFNILMIIFKLLFIYAVTFIVIYMMLPLVLFIATQAQRLFTKMIAFLLVRLRLLYVTARNKLSMRLRGYAPTTKYDDCIEVKSRAL